METLSTEAGDCPQQKRNIFKGKADYVYGTHIYPMEREFSKLGQSDWRWTAHPEEEWLKKTKIEGIWNFIYSYMYVALYKCVFLLR
ncbi:unnamed protein product [Brassica oleracea]